MNFSDMKNLGSIMKNMKQFQSKMKEVKASFETKTITAESGGGDVSVLMNLDMKIVSIDIADHLLGIENKQILCDLIIGASQAATEKAKQAAKDELTAISNELGIPLPGEAEDLF